MAQYQALSGAEEAEDAGKLPSSSRPGNPELTASFGSRLFLHWFSDLLRLGRSRKLDAADIYAPGPKEQSASVAKTFNVAWLATEGRHKSPGRRMVAALFQLGRNTWLTLFFLKLVGDLLQFVMPLCLQAIIRWLGDPDCVPPSWAAFVPAHARGYFFVFLMVAASLVQTMLNAHSQLMGFRLGVQVRSQVILAIYAKSLRQSTAARGDSTTGQVVNLMSSDSMRLMWNIPWMHFLPSGLMQIFVSIWMLSDLIGAAALLAGCSMLLIVMPYTTICIRKMNEFNEGLMSKRDARVARVNEALQAIKLVKCNAWEAGFIDYINVARDSELKSLFKYLLAYLSSSVAWEATPLLIAIGAFTVYTVQGNSLTPEVAFTALSLFDIMVMPTQAFGWVINDCLQIWVSVNRIGRFLVSPEISTDAVKQMPPDHRGEEAAIAIRGSSFNWGSPPPPDATSKEIKKLVKQADKAKEVGVLSQKRHADISAVITGDDGNQEGTSKNFSLADVELNVAQGALLAVVGAVGGGKSSLLNAIMGEMQVEGGAVELRGRLAYVAQTAFITNDTLRNNILFGIALDKEVYNTVLKCCCLLPDLKLLSAGDNTEIGEQGINLSGGQRQRLSLARATYAALMGEAEILLLDDVLSAVDAHVGAKIFAECITGVLRDKTVVLVTHAIQYLPNCDSVIVMDDGKIVEEGKYSRLMADQDSALGKLVNTFQGESSSDLTPRAAAEASSEAALPEAVEEAPEEEAKESSGGDLTEEEKRDEGRVSADVYLAYFRAAGYAGVARVVSLFALSPLMQLATSVWLAMWSENRLDMSQTSYLFWYGFISVAAIVAVIIRQALRSWITVVASRKIHANLLASVVAAPMSFFHTTPVGRVLNRFSSDISTIDEQFFDSMGDVFRNLFKLISTLIVMIYANAIFLIFAVPIFWLYYKINWFFIPTSRELKRLDSVTRSPVFSHFSETLSGSATIRAYGASQRFNDINMEKLDTNVAPLVLGFVAGRWLMLYTQGLIGCSALAVTATLAVAYGGNPAISAVAISYSMNLSWNLSWFVQQLTATETQAVSMERLTEYTNLKPEEKAAGERDRQLAPTPAANWPSIGKIEFRSLVLRYRPGLPPALKGLQCVINPGAKVGVCGRTGAGKSSLTVALLRLADELDGAIFIDDVDHQAIPLALLRSRLALIPQEATMFAGDVRFNLDPLGLSTDDALWSALDSVELGGTVRESGGLGAAVSEDGANWSQGQRQLLCIARALLRQAKIVMLDEATASCDVQTDAMIQRMMRKVFADKTVLTIAHRLNTIADSDQIMVLSKGKVAEFGPPQQLLEDPRGLYRGLVDEAESAMSP